MFWKPNVWTILFVVLGIAALATATTATFYNIEDAKNALNSNTEISEIGCFVTKIYKIGHTSDELDNNAWTAQFEYRYLVDGVPKTGIDEFLLPVNNMASAKKLAEPLCDTQKLMAEEIYGKITEVIVETLAVDNAILEQKYTPTDKKWSDISSAPAG